MANIFASMNAVMEDCGFIGKDSVNPQQKYKFRGIDAVMNALNPALRKRKVFVVPEVLDQTREERQTAKGGLLIYSVIKVKYTFYAEDGSSVSAVVVGEGMDSGDKASNKAMSAAFKYACFQAFCIPTGEMRDSEEDSLEPLPKQIAEEAVQYEEVRRQTIGIDRAIALQQYLEKEGIPVAMVMALYKVKKLEDLTEKQHVNIIEHIKEIKEKVE